MRIRLQHPALREFFEQLRFAPTRQRHKHLAAVEKLMLMIDAQQEYPFEFIVFRITGFRPAVAKYEDCLIRGDALLSDFRVWLSQISRQLDIPASAQPERIFTVEELAERFSVSKKTIRRWETRGLAGKIYLFDDGRKRKGFSASTVQKFEEDNRELLTRSAQFTKLDEAEKKHIYDLACQTTQTDRRRTRNELLRQISKSTGRARETIRYVLEEMEQRLGPCQEVPVSRGRLNAKEAAQIYKLSHQGIPVRDLAMRFKKSRSTLHRIINQHRAKELMGRRIEFIHSPDFDAPDAETRLLNTPTATLTGDKQEATMLTRRQEANLFCRYNFLKYRASRLRAEIRPQKPSVEPLKHIEKLLDEADRVKQYIVQCNMPLAVSIAGRHQGAQMTMNELVSEGMIALMAAVEKFDYTRGYRFSTYAGWAIAKDFARKIPAEAQRPDRAGGSDIDNMPHDIRMGNLPDVTAVEQAQHDLIGVINSNLDERERFIILNHYPIDTGGVIRKKPMTLKQIGQTLGLTKERVRQIELQALHKLRQSLSPEQFDLLTG